MDTQSHSFAKSSLDIASATSLINSARQIASAMGIEVALTVTDVRGHLKAFEATDNVPFLATEIAVDKAWTAVSLGTPTHLWSDLLAGKSDVHRTRLVAVGGGYPIIDDGNIIGGIGVSGGSPLQNQEIAVEALSATGFQLP
jgi:uncharacterized protein GlcG (DUF336 family)